jgi:hypothetical protein
MSRPRHLARVLLVASIVFAVGCTPPAPFSRDPTIATRQVSKLIPKGTPEALATSKLRERGFQLSRLSSDAATNHLLIGTCTRGEVTWQVGLVIIEHKVAASTVTILK